MHRSLLVALAVLLPGVLAPAQVLVLSASGGVTVSAGGMPALLAPGVDMTPGAHLSAAANGGHAVLSFAPTTDPTAIDLHWTLACSAVSVPQASVGSVTHHQIHSARPIDGRFVLTWSTNVTGTGTSAFALDLHDDGTIDATDSAVIASSLPAGMTTIRVEVDAAASAGVLSGPWGVSLPYQGSATPTLTIRFEPTHATMVPFGAGCGVTLAAVPNFLGGVDLHAQCPPAARFAIAVLGLDQAAAPLPLPPGCLLHTTPLASLWQNVGRTAAADWTIGMPAGHGPFAFAAQAVALDIGTMQATASPGLWVVTQ